MNETKCWLFRKSNKIDKPLSRQTKKKNHRRQLSIAEGKWDSTTDNLGEIPIHI